MKQQHIADALNTLAKMAELEIAVARFYETCGQRWVEEGDIWLNLAEMEIQHAKNIKQIADAVRGRPEKFKAVRFVNISSIDNVISRLNLHAEQVISGRLSRKEAIHIANDTESSILELLFTGIFETEDVMYQDLIAEITSETKDHKNFFNRKMDSLNGTQKTQKNGVS